MKFTMMSDEVEETGFDREKHDADFREIVETEIRDMLKMVERVNTEEAIDGHVLTAEDKQRGNDTLKFTAKLLEALIPIREEAVTPLVLNFATWLADTLLSGPPRWEQLMITTQLEEQLSDVIQGVKAKLELSKLMKEKDDNTIQ